MSSRRKEGGAIAWMARNPVASNLVMIALLVGGFIVASNVKQEVFPDFDLDAITVSVVYPGASPSEVEQGILLAVEEGVRGLDGVKRVSATASEGLGTVTVELLLGTDANKALSDVKNAVDRISSFPRDAERPIVSLLTARREVIALVIHGKAEESVLRALAERARAELLQDPRITQAELSGVRAPEIAVEVSQERLRAHGLTLEGIASEIQRAAVELPAGGVKTEAGEVLLRTAERRDVAGEFGDLVLLSRPDGTQLRLADVADVRDDFTETDQAAFFEGDPAVMISVYRVGDQTPLEVAAAVKSYAETLRASLPPGFGVVTWDDRSEVYRDRVDLLLRNALMGLALVFFLLGIFLEPRLAFWVTMGIPISFLGSFLFLPMQGVSINMISLFAFIVTLGMVVDDAIVVGENAFELRRRGMDRFQAAIQGARQVSVPVTFSILTTVVAFAPLFFVPGFSGKFFVNIPAIVVPVLLVSLGESLFVLPSHLAHIGGEPRNRALRTLLRAQARASAGIQWFIDRNYAPLVRRALRWRYLTVAIALAALAASAGLVAGGRLEFTFMPKIDSDLVTATAYLPYGAPVAEAEALRVRLDAAAEAVVERNGGPAIKRGLYGQIGAALGGFGGRSGPGGGGGSHIVSVQIFLVPSDRRSISASKFAEAWRQELGPVAGIESLSFRYSTGRAGSAAVSVQLSHEDLGLLEQASGEVADGLRSFAGVKDIDDGFAEGKVQFDLTLRPEARSVGITASALARQVRSAFYGAEALRQQRGRDELRVMVRLPKAERRSEYNIEELLVRTPQGGDMPLGVAASVQRGRSYTQIRREEGRRIVEVTADVVPGQANPGKVREALEKTVLPAVMAAHPGLTYSFEGEMRDQRESLTALGRGFLIALIGIFALLAIPFRSYTQPLLVMTAIPFGIVGAILGHVLMGYDLSLISMMGIVALSGVVVNDSLVLIDATNQRRAEGASAVEAIASAAQRRFRPIVLTSVTTFFGLAPMIFESSVQARFLVPMALSLGFGVLFSTLIVLLVVPSLYLMLEDAQAALRRLRGLPGPEAEASATSET